MCFNAGTAAPFVVNLDTYTSGEGVLFIGPASARVGFDIVNVGDHNGDGFNDYMLSSHPTRTIVIVMKRNTTYTEMDITSIASDQYYRVIKGPAVSPAPQTGTALGGIGDINGDSFDDVLIGAAEGTVSGRGKAGYAFVIFGMAGPFTELALTATWAPSALGFMIRGVAVNSGFVSRPRTVCGL